MNFFKKLFGSDSKENLDPRGFVEETAKALIEKAGWELDVTVTQETRDEQNTLVVDFFGADEKLICEREGQYLEAIQIFLKRVLQNRFPEDHSYITVDAAGFSEANQKELEQLADRLRQSVLSKKRPVYCRALPPKDRKIIHQYLSTDNRIRTKSVGEGTFKKIKIFLAQSGDDVASTASE